MKIECIALRENVMVFFSRRDVFPSSFMFCPYSSLTLFSLFVRTVGNTSRSTVISFPFTFHIHLIR